MLNNHTQSQGDSIRQLNLDALIRPVLVPRQVIAFVANSLSVSFSKHFELAHFWLHLTLFIEIKSVRAIILQIVEPHKTLSRLGILRHHDFVATRAEQISAAVELKL